MMRVYWLSSLFIGLLSMFTNQSYAETVTGGAFLATRSPHFPCRPVLRWYKKQNKIFHATLYQSSFGASDRCLRRIAALQQDVTLQLYLSNEACRRNRTCERGDLLPELSTFEYEQLLLGELWPVSQSQKRLKAVRDAASSALTFCESVRRPGFRCLLALGLESNFNLEAARILRWMVIFDGWEREQIVFNPVADSPAAAGVSYWHEHHSLQSDSKRQIVTMDGNDTAGMCSGAEFGLQRISAESVFRFLRGETVAMFGAWCPGWQGQPKGGPRRLRDLVVRWNDLKRWRKLFNSVR